MSCYLSISFPLRPYWDKKVNHVVHKYSVLVQLQNFKDNFYHRDYVYVVKRMLTYAMALTFKREYNKKISIAYRTGSGLYKIYPWLLPKYPSPRYSPNLDICNLVPFLLLSLIVLFTVCMIDHAFSHRNMVISITVLVFNKNKCAIIQKEGDYQQFELLFFLLLAWWKLFCIVHL